MNTVCRATSLAAAHARLPPAGHLRFPLRAGSPGTRHLRDVYLDDAKFDDVDLTGARFRWVLFRDVLMRGTWFANVRIEGEIAGLTVNGVDVAPLVRAELERREPDLAKMRPDRPGRVPGGVGHARAASSASFPVGECLLTLLKEEWWHRQFAVRDLAVLEERSA